EKLGSFHHCATRWLSVGIYSQSNNPAMTAVFHHEGAAGLAAGAVARALSLSDCSTWLTGNRFYYPGDSLQHKRSEGDLQSKAESQVITRVRLAAGREGLTGPQGWVATD